MIKKKTLMKPEEQRDSERGLHIRSNERRECNELFKLNQSGILRQMKIFQNQRQNKGFFLDINRLRLITRRRPELLKRLKKVLQE